MDFAGGSVAVVIVAIDIQFVAIGFLGSDLTRDR